MMKAASIENQWRLAFPLTPRLAAKRNPDAGEFQYEQVQTEPVHVNPEPFRGMFRTEGFRCFVWGSSWRRLPA